MAHVRGESFLAAFGGPFLLPPAGVFFVFFFFSLVATFPCRSRELAVSPSCFEAAVPLLGFHERLAFYFPSLPWLHSPLSPMCLLRLFFANRLTGTLINLV